MKIKNLLNKISEEIDVFVTFYVLKLLELLGPTTIASLVRAVLLRLYGFKIGKNVKIMTGFNVAKKNLPVEIGEGTFINKNVYFDINAPLKIGKHCQIGFNTIFSNSMHVLASDFIGKRPSIDAKPITIEDYVWVACNVTILGGVTIHKGAVVAAGSLVNKDIPPNAVVAGVPAKIIKYTEVNNEE